MTAPPASDSRARGNVIVLFLANALLGAQMPMIFTIGGLAGQSLSPNPCLATMPISMIVLGSMLSATPVSGIMQRYGRRVGFSIGSAFGALGALVAAYGLFQQSFGIFLLGSLFTGTYMSTQGFFRFAATDTASPKFQPKAISYVMAGGLIAALLGPQLGKLTNDALVVPFMGTYLLVMALNLAGPILFSFLDIPRPERPETGEDAPKGRNRWQLLTTPRILVAVICGMVSYALMNLVMTSTPLAVVGCGFDKSNAADVVSAHVLAMYVPSFFTGHLIARFGVEKVMGAGLLILAGAGAVALQGVELENFFGALVLLGLGWNFGFIGATSMLAQSHTKAERGRMQGLNDLIVFGGVTCASFASGGLMNCSGASAAAGWSAVNLAMAPLLVLAGGALIWLVLRPKDQTAGA
ncbi:Predicted arabinose efflux permease, MFS family [Pseudooceanicola antarcticus]|nr:MFS transporter [Pseudooceanicola antarcticus]SNY55881.1 Predicted arabinose efflux permease, MFS family [Pseudooceanicola antarcticus]